MNSLLIAQNIIKRAFRSGKELILMMGLPIVAIILMTMLTGNQSAQKVPTGLVNLDNGMYSERLVNHISSQKDVKIVTLNKNNYMNAVKNGKSSILVLIPDSFSKDIESGKKTYVEFYSSSGMNVTYEKLKQEINQYILSLYMINSAADGISTVSDTLFTNIDENPLSTRFDLAGDMANEEQRERLIQSIGFSLMFLMVFVFNTIGTILEDKKKLTLARMFTFHVKEWEIIAGNLLGSLALGTIQLIPVITVLALVYKINSAAEIFGLFLILFCFMITTIGLGIGISGFIKNDYNPSLVISVVIFPTNLLGGCLIPASMLPSFIGRIGYAVPQKWVMSAIQQLMAGAGLQGILLDIGIILMFGLAFATFGVKMLKPLSE